MKPSSTSRAPSMLAVGVAASLLLLPQARSADVSSYNVFKRQSYLQTDAGPPILLTNNPYSFSSSVNTPVVTNTLLSASV